MSAYTKAPWFVATDPKFPAELAIDAIVDGQRIHVALVHGVGTDEETQANAALIVASPDMKAVLDDLEDSFDKEIYPEQRKEDFDALDDREYSVTITAKQWRALSRALSKAEGGPDTGEIGNQQGARVETATPIVNFVSTRTGKVQAVCEFCDRRSAPITPEAGGEPSMWALPRGWSCAPYPRDFVHEDGSTGTLWTCPTCDKRLDKGESLFPHESRRVARQARHEGRTS